LQVFRTSVAGRQPNTTVSTNSQYINAGGLALNMPDQILYTSDGTNLLVVGANAPSYSVSGGNVSINSAGVFVSNTTGVVNAAIYIATANIGLTSTANLTFASGSKIIDSTGSQGTVGQVLTSNGVGNVYWGTVSGINTAAQYTWTNTQIFNSNLTVNSGFFVTGNSTSLITIGGTTGRGTITLGQSSANQTIYIGGGTLASGNKLSITMGALNGSGTTTAIAIGTVTANANCTVTLAGQTTLFPGGGQVNSGAINYSFSLSQFPATWTDTFGTSNINSLYMNYFATQTLASLNTYNVTNLFGTYFQNPANGTNITTTNKYAVGCDSFYIANSTGLGISLTANSTLVNASSLNVIYQTNTATLFVTTSANLASSNVIANTAGVFVSNTTGVVNAAVHSVGTSFIANSTGITTTGYVNVAAGQVVSWNNDSGISRSAAASLSLGNGTQNDSSGTLNLTKLYATGSINVSTTFTANSTLVNTAAINITGQTNTATLFVTTSSNLASSNVIANTSGVFVANTTGVVNAAIYTATANVTVGNATQNVVITNAATTFSNSIITGFLANVNLQSVTAYTLANTDSGKILEINNTAAATVTLPNSAPAGFTCTIVQVNTGNVTFANAAGTTFFHRSTGANTGGQWALATVYVRSNAGAAAVWVLGGDTA